MDRKDIQGYDFSHDILKPQDVINQLRAHDDRMDDDKHHMALAKAAYSTKFWQYIEGQEDFNTADFNTAYGKRDGEPLRVRCPEGRYSPVLT